jgi:proteasome lid subunit RPN8/RPN11
MRLTRGQLEQLIAQARTDAPNETCGVINGKDGRALKIYPMKNVDAEPRTRYNCAPQELWNAFHEIEENGWEHLAIYHSHPATAAYPSPTDIARAFYPDAVYLVVSLMNPAQAVVRGFRIVDGRVTEITIDIEETENESSRTNSRRAARRASRSRAGRAMAALSERRSAHGNVRRARGRIPEKV